MKTPSPSRILSTSIYTLLAFAALANLANAATKSGMAARPAPAPNSQRR